MTIIFDLDGTLIDASDRLYQLFQDLIPQSEFSKTEYWELKRNKVNHQMIIERYFPDIDYIKFNNQWLELIETDKYLYLDKNFPDTVSVLNGLKNKCNLVLLTSRRVKESMLRELERLDVHRYFTCTLATGTTNKREVLINAISNGIILKEDKDLFVSDVGKDIALGRQLGYKTVAITRGFMSKECLISYNPDHVIDDLTGLYEIID